MRRRQEGGRGRQAEGTEEEEEAKYAKLTGAVEKVKKQCAKSIGGVAQLSK